MRICGLGNMAMRCIGICWVIECATVSGLPAGRSPGFLRSFGLASPWTS